MDHSLSLGRTHAARKMVKAWVPRVGDVPGIPWHGREGKLGMSTRGSGSSGNLDGEVGLLFPVSLSEKMIFFPFLWEADFRPAS